jgi:hypothetical protein
MAGGDRLFKPSERGIRDPLTNAQDNGRINNPPRYPKLGGFISAAKGFFKNSMRIGKPGDTK